jgi:hypothetical protein
VTQVPRPAAFACEEQPAFLADVALWV